MATVKPIPEGSEGLIPHLVVEGAGKALDFYKKAFGAEELFRIPGPDGRICHAELRLSGSTIYVCEDMPEKCGGKSRSPRSLGGSPVTVHRYVRDVDAAIRQAEKAGATVEMAAQDMFWGDRFGVVRDPFGHSWSFATHVREVSPAEMQKAMNAACSGQETSCSEHSPKSGKSGGSKKR